MYSPGRIARYREFVDAVGTCQVVSIACLSCILPPRPSEETEKTYSPDLGIMPINHRMHPHKRRPALIRLIEMGQVSTMRIRPPRTHKHRLKPRPLLQIRLERLPHRQGIPAQIKVKLGRGRLDKFVDLGKGVRADNIDRLERFWKGRGRCRAWRGGEGRVGRGLRVSVDSAVVEAGGDGSRGGGGSCGGFEVAGETSEDQYEEDEAVFAAVVGERKLFEAVVVYV